MTEDRQEGREAWIDMVKVLACLLVLLGHLFQGLTKSGIMEKSVFLRWFDYTIYFFHVPVFFICSGYLYQKRSRVASFKEWRKNVCEKAVNLGIPYLVFSLATYLLKVIFSESVNEGYDKGFFQLILTEPMSPYWYLYILFFLFICYPTLRNRRQIIFISTATVLCFTLQRNPYASEIYALQGIFHWGIWFLAGMLLAYWHKTIEFRTGYLLVSFLLIPVSLIGFGRELKVGFWLPYSFLTGVFGCLLVFQSGSLLAKRLPAKWIVFCSRNTMPVFLMHTIFAAGLRSALVKLGVTDSLIHVTLGLLVSILGPIITAAILKKSRYFYWIVQPGFRLKQ